MLLQQHVLPAISAIALWPGKMIVTVDFNGNFQLGAQQINLRWLRAEQESRRGIEPKASGQVGCVFQQLEQESLL